MVNNKDLEQIYLQNLEESIVEYLAESLQIDFRKATDIYYKSKLSEQITNNQYGIANLDYKYLVEDLLINESNLVKDLYTVPSG